MLEHIQENDHANALFVEKKSGESHFWNKTCGEKPSQCGNCEITFLEKNILIEHLRTYTGEKQHPCTVCHKDFSHEYDLLNHERSHSGEKPFKSVFLEIRLS